MAEGIPVNLVEFADNRPVLDMLLSRPMGLLALLDEESRFPRATDKSLIGNMICCLLNFPFLTIVCHKVLFANAREKYIFSFLHMFAYC